MYITTLNFKGKSCVSRRLRRALLVLLAMPILFGMPGALYQWIAIAYDQVRYPPPGRLVAVGGYRLHLYRMGANQGHPTVTLLGCGG